MFLNTFVQECAKLSQLALLKCPSYNYGTSQSPGCGNGAIAVAVKFSCSWISPRFPRRAPVPHTVPWVQQPAFCPCQLVALAVLHPSSPFPAWSLGHHSGTWVFQTLAVPLCWSGLWECSTEVFQEGQGGAGWLCLPSRSYLPFPSTPFLAGAELLSSPQATSPWEICFDIGPEHFSSD